MISPIDCSLVSGGPKEDILLFNRWRWVDTVHMYWSKMVFVVQLTLTVAGRANRRSDLNKCHSFNTLEKKCCVEVRWFSFCLKLHSTWRSSQVKLYYPILGYWGMYLVAVSLPFINHIVPYKMWKYHINTTTHSIVTAEPYSCRNDLVPIFSLCVFCAVRVYYYPQLPFCIVGL